MPGRYELPAPNWKQESQGKQTSLATVQASILPLFPAFAGPFSEYQQAHENSMTMIGQQVPGTGAAVLRTTPGRQQREVPWTTLAPQRKNVSTVTFAKPHGSHAICPKRSRDGPAQVHLPRSVRLSETAERL